MLVEVLSPELDLAEVVIKHLHPSIVEKVCNFIHVATVSTAERQGYVVKGNRIGFSSEAYG
jgi:hypothetical protein